ncbi:MAG: hypothetical protein EPN62_05665 [Candidimonas sp.]|nr:MAG: hypothetical protein EPN77_16720 [Candidimonas sp.]TAM24794.1 MAG: hypothetical protein EPN62_05665 [Candidimonas sp.]
MSNQPQPNKHGVYCEDAWTETVSHKTPSGASVDVHLVQLEAGWIADRDYSFAQEGGGGWPSIHDKIMPTRDEAINAVLSKVRRSAERNLEFSPHHMSDRDTRQCKEIIDWIDSRTRQMELFA